MPENKNTKSAQYKVTIIAVGNDAEGDEGLAPRLLQALLAHHDEAPWLSTLRDSTLRVEHTLELRNADLVLIVEADAEVRSPYEFSEVIESAASPAPLTGEVSPSDLLHVLKNLSRGTEPPRCFSLRVHGERFSVDQGLTIAAQNNLELATALVHSLLENPHPEYWEDMPGT